jgi:alpha-1,3-rhamnosyl/mannosyltransferase
MKPCLLWSYDLLLKGHARRWLNRRHFDLYHEPNYLTLPCDLPTVMTLHDLSVYSHPEWHPPERVARHQRHFERSLQQCVHFLTDSEFIRQEVIRTLSLPVERVSCIPLGVRPHFRPLPGAEVHNTLRQLGLPPRYLLYLGTLEPRKNVLRLMQVYCSLPAPQRDRWPLLLVGGWGWKTEEIAEYYHREARHRGVRQLGYLADEHLAAVYNGARALVFPSLYEGFGLPPLEMMACGGAVLASTAGALVETVGTRAHLVEPEDSDAWRVALLRILREDDWWLALREGVTEVARPYTWERCAARTLRAYRHICGAPTDEAGPVPRAA